MTSKAEKIGAALAKAVKASTGITAARFGDGSLYRTNMRNVQALDGLPGDSGPIDLRFLIDKGSSGADHTVAWSVLKPGARHALKRQRNCDAFFVILRGKGQLVTDQGTEPLGDGDVVYCRRGVAYGIDNSSDQDLVMIWGWMGAGSVEAAGIESADRSTP